MDAMEAVSIDELRLLRQTLTLHRLEHERMMARMQVLKAKSRQTRLNAIRVQLESQPELLDSSQ